MRLFASAKRAAFEHAQSRANYSAASGMYECMRRVRDESVTDDKASSKNVDQG